MKKTATFLFLFLFSGISLQTFAQSDDNDDYDRLKYRKWRITIINPIGTNGVAAPKYTAKYSINLIGGYHGGLNGAEFGTLYNYNRDYASGFQIAGLVNATGGYMEGINIAGLVNYASNDMSGIQASGLGNISKDDIEGLQAAGAFNFAGDDISGLQGSLGANIALGNVEGLQASGLFNYAGSNISGLMVSGGGNIANKDMEGLMVSSFFNVARDYGSGLLVTGGLNYSENQEGLLVSGIANITKNMDGLQVSGILNAAQTANGMQIGLINFAKEFNGASIGFLSLYGNGRKNIDMRISDAGFTDFAITTGTHRVYNSAIFGYNSFLDRDVYRFGLAVGLEKNINDSFRKVESEKLFVNQEFSVLHHFEEEWTKKTNLIFSYKYMLGYRFASGASIYGGPSYNIQVTRVNTANDYTWYSLWSPEWKGRQYRFWVGFTAGIRLFKQKNLPLLDDYDFEFGRDW